VMGPASQGSALRTRSVIRIQDHDLREVFAVVTITVDKEMCKGCNLCIVSCPKAVLAVSQERGKAGFLVPEATNPKACTKCKNCEVICPDFAIVVEEG